MNWTKIGVWTLLVFMAAVPTQAQVRLGVKGGMNVSGFVTDSKVVDKQTPGVNFQLGGTFRYDFWVLSLQSDLLYTQKTFQMDDAADKYYLQQYANLSSSDPALRYTSSAIEIPIDLRYRFKVKKSNFFVGTGPSFAFRLGGSFNGDADLSKAYGEVFPFRWFDCGYGFVGGVELGKMQVGLRWDWYLNRMGSVVENQYETGNVNLFHDMKYRNLSLTVGYFFR
jgi:hypothetical protein